MKFTEEQLMAYAKPLSETENQQCKNAISMVRDALKELDYMDEDDKGISLLYEDTHSYSIKMRSRTGSKKISIFVQGSYANKTNVRSESDVDIAVVEEDIFKMGYRGSFDIYPQTYKDYGFHRVNSSDYSFKDKVEECLKVKFGDDVERKDKSIKICGNTYRNDADTVPCTRYRDYRKDYDYDESNYVAGIVITTDQGEEIINYPEQHIEQGRKKNIATNLVYKKMVRIIKTLRYKMCDEGYSEATEVSSFGLESLLWNVPNEIFTTYATYRFGFKYILEYLYSNKESFIYYKEANGIKKLCSTVYETEKYKKFIDKLYDYYE